MDAPFNKNFGSYHNGVCQFLNVDGSVRTLAQGAIAISVLALHTFARFMSGLPLLHSWVTVALALLIASSCLRWQLAKSKELPERVLDVLNVIDIGLKTIDVTTHVWSKEHRTFVKGPHKRFNRSEYVATD